MKMSKPDDQDEMYAGEKLDDLSVRLSDVNLNDFDTVWSKLSDKEKGMFEKCLTKGDMKFMKLWKPWWEALQTKYVFDVVHKKCS